MLDKTRKIEPIGIAIGIAIGIEPMGNHDSDLDGDFDPGRSELDSQVKPGNDSAEGVFSWLSYPASRIQPIDATNDQ